MSFNKITRLSGICLILLIQVGCKKASDIISVEIATGGCFGPCQYTVTQVDTSLKLKFFGGEFALPPPPGTKNVHKGYFTATINKAMWDSITNKLESIKYKQLDTSYHNSVDDQSLELIVRYKTGVKHVRAQSVSLPPGVAKTFYWIADLQRKVTLVGVKAPLDFETQKRKRR